MSASHIIKRVQDSIGCCSADVLDLIANYLDVLIAKGVITGDDLEAGLGVEEEPDQEPDPEEPDWAPVDRTPPKTRRKSLPANEIASVCADILYYYDFRSRHLGLDPWMEVTDVLTEPKNGKVGLDVEVGGGTTRTVWVDPDELVYYE